MWKSTQRTFVLGDHKSKTKTHQFMEVAKKVIKMAVTGQAVLGFFQQEITV